MTLADLLAGAVWLPPPAAAQEQAGSAAAL